MTPEAMMTMALTKIMMKVMKQHLIMPMIQASEEEEEGLGECEEEEDILLNTFNK